MGAAIQMFSLKAQEVKVMFNEERERLMEDFEQMKSMLHFYEDKIKRLVATNTRQERLVIEAKQYFHHFLRARKEYAKTKELARMSLNDLIGSKYTSMTNAVMLDQSFDFYSAGIRLQAHERTKISRSIVIQQMEKDVKEEAQKAELLENEIEALYLMVGQA